MKQGSGTSRAGDQKREPIAHAVNPEAVSRIGIHQVATPVPLYDGRGYEAPKASTTIHHCGSQGKHR